MRPIAHSRVKTYGIATAVATLALTASACGSTKTTSGSTKTTSSQASSTTAAGQCNLAALNAATTPVNITFWESAGGTAKDPHSGEHLLLSIVNKFNASQTKIHVTDVNQQSYFDGAWTPYLNSLRTHTSPNIVYFDDNYVKDAVDSKSFVPVAACAAADKYSTSDFLPKAIAQQSVNGTLWGMPYTGSGYIMYYNQQAMTKAGIAAPPRTFAQVVADAAKFKAAGYSDGISLSNDPVYLQLFDASAGKYYLNNNNGRGAKSATAASFDNPTSLDFLNYVHEMVASGTEKGYAATGPGTAAFDNLLAVGNGLSGLTISPSGTLGTVEAVAKAYPKATFKVAPVPSVGSTNLGLPSEGQALYLPKSSTPAQLEASWVFLKYLVSASHMATFDAGTGFVPVRSSAAAQPAMTSLWASNPAYKVAYTEMTGGTVNQATAGPLLGPLTSSDNSIANMLAKVETDPTANPSALLSQAQSQTTSLITSYNASN